MTIKYVSMMIKFMISMTIKFMISVMIKFMMTKFMITIMININKKWFGLLWF